MNDKNMPTTCPECENELLMVDVTRTTEVKGVEVRYSAQMCRCSVCGLEIADMKQAAGMQDQIADAYREQMGLLTGASIRAMREGKGLSQIELADALSVGVASIKRWENGVVQTKPMNNLMRSFFFEQEENIFTGNRAISIPRILLVLREFEHNLGRLLLKKNDRMLYAAKYLWFADMVAFRECGMGMTGAAYAALPQGPQLNNYRDLVDNIQGANTGEALPLNKKEKAIICDIAKRFPRNKQAYDASHNERLWQNSRTGALISYARANELTGIPPLDCRLFL